VQLWNKTSHFTRCAYAHISTCCCKSEVSKLQLILIHVTFQQQDIRRLNARPAVVDRNPCARSQTSNVLKTKDQWHPNLPDLNPLDYLPCLGGGQCRNYHKCQPKPKTIAELKEVLQVIWDSLLQGPIDKDCQRVLKATEGLSCS